MEFSVGDMVMHPQFGPARITGLEDQEWVEGFKRYFVMEVPGHHMILRLPVRQLKASGLRPLMSRSTLVQVMRTLSGTPKPLSEDSNARYNELQGRMRTCKPLMMASAIRDLTWRKRDASLTKRDVEVLDRARHLLTSEIASATDSQVEMVDQAIDLVLAKAIAAHPQETEANS